MSRVNGVERPERFTHPSYSQSVTREREREKKKNSHATPFHVSLSNSQGLFVILFNNEYYDGLVFHLLKNLTHKYVIANNLKCV